MGFCQCGLSKFGKPRRLHCGRLFGRDLGALFDSPDDICKVIYTANAVELLYLVIRKAVKNRKLLPHDQAALKVVYLAIDAAAKSWSTPIRKGVRVLNRFMIDFPVHMPET